MTDPSWPTMSEGRPDPEPPTPAQPVQAPTPGPSAQSAQAPNPGSSAQSVEAPTCPDCGVAIDPAAWYCEACGNPLVPTVTAPAPTTTPAADAPSTQTRRLGARASHQTTCRSCGGTIDADGYCQTCGAKAPSVRDHFTEAPAGWLGGVCDRGVHHPRNEDALALWAQGDRAVLVVCDGVSTSIDSDVASLAAARSARDLLAARLADPSAPDDAALAQALVDATAAANQAVVDTTDPDSTNAASATFAAAVVVGGRVHFANLGDSRVYALAAEPLLLSVDDSMAQAFIAEGMPREEAESLPRAHAITKWLGRDALDIVPRTGVLDLLAPGWVVVCSDGLWNYASGPEAFAAQLVAATQPDADPVPVAQRLVDWANAQGGHDNITVALARVPAPTELSDPHGALAPPESDNSAGAASPTLGAAVTSDPKEQPHHG